MPPLVTRVKVLGAKVESTAGTAETLTASEAEILVFDPVMEPGESTFHQRTPSAPTMGHFPGIVGMKAGTLSCSVEVKGSGVGSTNPGWAVLLQGCGLSVATQTYTPVSSMASQKTLTLGLWEDGLYKRLKGAM